MRESTLQHNIRSALGREPDVKLWRNTVGAGKIKGQWITWGLQVGSSDLVGILAPAGRWFCLELKTPRGRSSPEQKRWVKIIREMGGFAAVVRSVDEAWAALERARKGEGE